MNFRFGINFRLLLLGILPAGLIAITLAGYFIHTRFNDLDTALTERGHLLARQLATASISGLKENNQQVLQKLANSKLSEHDVVYVRIYQNDGTLLAYASNSTENQSQSQQNDALEHLLTFQTQAFVNAPSQQKQEQKTAGSVSITLSKQRTSQSQWAILRNSLLFTLIGLIGTGILAYQIAKRIREPIHSLTDSIKAIAKGNLHTRASLKSEIPELSALKSGVNLMVIELQKNQRRLESQVLHATPKIPDITNYTRKKERRT